MQKLSIISSGSSASSRKQCPSVAEQQSHSWLGNQLMRPESPSVNGSILLVNSTCIASCAQSVGFLYYSEDTQVKEKVFSIAI
ncbi:hypothetical protein CDAR_216401 [Caerostris darwini]|uniref:Uncharacterized protein n=1 Tax=Caerostris darwini TaxID=1538125 RepID=A0AAV4UAY2_9ARAC|nr:hypothetical protein CDAR_216401 [Caerostris darwini]